MTEIATNAEYSSMGCTTVMPHSGTTDLQDGPLSLDNIHVSYVCVALIREAMVAAEHILQGSL